MKKKFCIIGIIALLLIAATYYVYNEMNNDNFFPKGVFSEDKQLDDRFYNSYSRHLMNLKEANLYKSKKKENISVFRFLYFRSFDNPIVIRIEVNTYHRTGVLYYKTGIWKNGESILKESKQIELNSTEINELLGVIKENSFWEIPTKDPNKELGLDGSDWVFEGVEDNKYHLIYRWSPEKGPVRELGLFFITLSKEMVNDIY